MANTLTDVSADIYKAAEIVGAERTGLIASVTVNGGSEAVAKGRSVSSVRTPAPTLNTSVTEAMTIPEGDDQTITELDFTVNNVANVFVNMTGEDTRVIDTHHSLETVEGNRMLRAFRAIRNKIETDLGDVIYQGASRAVGSAGTTPFATNLDAATEVRQILVDNGYFFPGEVSLVVNTAASTNMLQLQQLTKANEAGTNRALRNGDLLDIFGMMIRESDGIALHTKGTGTSYVSNATTTEPIGETVIAVDTGSGTILAGDVITQVDDSDNAYVVNTALDSGTFTIGDPGLVDVDIDDGDAITVGNSYTPNVALNRSCVELVARPLAVPGEDAATNVLQVPDPYTGIVYEIREYVGFHKRMWSVSLVYGAKVWESAGVAVLMG